MTDGSTSAPPARSTDRDLVRTARRGRFVTFVIAVAAGMLISVFGFGTVRVSGRSMQPNLHDGDRALVLRFDAWLHRAGIGQYRPGDIVFFPDPTAPATGWHIWLNRHLLIKRIAAGPNARVGLHDGVLYVNGARHDESYLAGAYLGDATSPDVVVPPGEVYVLGDNRAPLASLDSRSFGSVASPTLEGRAVLVFWPLFRHTDAGWRWNPHRLKRDGR